MSFLRQLSSRIDIWKLCILCFAAAYAIFLATNLAYKSILWDESPHFIGGLLLSRGAIGQWIWTNSFYPPVFDLITATYFTIDGGASVFTGRLVAVTFAVLSIFVVYAIANRMYGPKVALLSGIFLGVMPGIVWVSRMAMIETMLIFTFSVIMLFFFKWLRDGRERDRKIFTVATVVGVAVKYQMIALAPIVVVLGTFFWKKDYLKSQVVSYFRRPRLVLTIASIVTVAIMICVILALGLLGPWFYAVQVGTTDKAEYSVRLPAPIYYFVEITWPSNDIHPVSLLLYLSGLVGIGLFTFRRKMEDKILLLWFAVVYLTFTIVPNREWRYVTVLFPVLAIAASSAVVSGFGKLQKVWQTANNSSGRKQLAKIAALSLIAFTVVGVSLSCVDAYTWVSREQTQVPVEQAVAYAAQGLDKNQSLMVACPVNHFNKQMVWFYLNAKTAHQNNVSQYPEQAVDAYMPDFNVTEFINLCQQNNTKYVLLYEYAEAPTYYNSTLTGLQIYDKIVATGRFEPQATVGAEPRRVFIMTLK